MNPQGSAEKDTIAQALELKEDSLVQEFGYDDDGVLLDVGADGRLRDAHESSFDRGFSIGARRRADQTAESGDMLKSCVALEPGGLG